MSFARIVPLLFLASIVACTDVSDPSATRPKIPSPGSPSSSQSALAARVVTLDEQFEAVANVEPSFGGLYFENGSLHIVLTDVTRNPSLVRQAILGVITDSRLATAPIVVRQGTYGFAQLAVWGRQLPRVFAINGVTSTDIDEVNNRLSIGVASGTACHLSVGRRSSLHHCTRWQALISLCVCLVTSKGRRADT